MPQNSKTMEYRPNWKIFAKEFIIGMLLIPFFGIGLVVLIYYYVALSKIVYRFSDDEITISHSPSYADTILIRDLTKTELIKSTVLGRFQTETLILKTESSTSTLAGIANAGFVQEVLESSIRQHRKISENKQEREKFTNTAPPGSLEKINDLVGMWQQGLISDEDYFNERRKFE
jgi:hypothetical protein